MISVAAALGYAGWVNLYGSDADRCYVCQRPVHAHSLTIAVDHGKPRRFCCPACALSELRRAGKPVEVTRLTEYLSGKPVRPEQAFMVQGSDVNMCARTQELTGVDKRPAGLQYDRCAPSLLAFSSQSEAANFAREHGGAVTPFRLVAAAFAQ